MEKSASPTFCWQAVFDQNPEIAHQLEGINGLRSLHEQYSRGQLKVLSDHDHMLIALWTGDEEKPGLVYVLNNDALCWRSVWVTTPWSGVEFLQVFHMAATEIGSIDELYSGSSGTIQISVPPMSLTIYMPVD
jgi:hypothetical protein